MGLSDKTVRSYLDILTGAFMMRQLQPWFENTRKRQVRSPKIYLRDSGLLHSLVNIPDAQTLLDILKWALRGKAMLWNRLSYPATQ